MKASGLVVLGSTGSIGRSCLEVVEARGEGVRVVGLAAGGNARLLADQAERFDPAYVAIADEKRAEELRSYLSGWPRKRILAGPDAAARIAAAEEADSVLNGIVGAAGLEPSLAALEASKRLLLANKETLVVAGALVMRIAERSGGRLIPVDSEHSSIHRCLLSRDRGEIDRIILTASGGPLLKRRSREAVTVSEVLQHPTWRMGRRITVDSATMLNKGFELIEAKWLFGFELDEIEILVHPQSVVHGLVRFTDGSLEAHLSLPDMRIPLSYALFGASASNGLWGSLRLPSVGMLEFMEVDLERFPCLGLAMEAARKGGTAPAVLNASDEIAVEAFLDRRIGFDQIAEVLQKVLEVHQVVDEPTLAQLKEADRWARETAEVRVQEISGGEMSEER